MAVTNTPAKQFEENVKNIAQEGAEKASRFGDRAKEAFSSAVDKSKEMASNVADKAKEATDTCGTSVNDATRALGQGMETLGSTIRQKMPHSGPLGAAGATVANTLESGGHYLETEGLPGIGKDLTAFVQRNPLPSLFFGIGLGFLIARLTMPKS